MTDLRMEPNRQLKLLRADDSRSEAVSYLVRVRMSATWFRYGNSAIGETPQRHNTATSNIAKNAGWRYRDGRARRRLVVPFLIDLLRR